MVRVPFELGLKVQMHVSIHASVVYLDTTFAHLSLSRIASGLFPTSPLSMGMGNASYQA